MNKLLLTAAAAAMSLTALAAPSGAWRPGAQKDAFRFAPKAGVELKHTVGAEAAMERLKARVAAGQAEVNFSSLPAASQTGYLETPKGELWFYTIEHKSTIIDHEYYKEEKITGYTVTVYDAEFNEIGVIDDDIELRDGEIGVAQVEVGSLLTQKFFNTDASYELMVFVSFNTANYVNVDRTYVYSLKSGTTTSNTCAVMDGYYVAAVNTATDAWSERYWITFYTEEATETPEVGGVMNSGDYVMTTYKYAGYAGMEDPVLKCRVPMIASPGENAIPFISGVKDGMPYFAVNRLKYCWFENPFDYDNEKPTADNELIIDLYSAASSWSSKIEKYSTTTLPLATTEGNVFFLYTGTFSYDDDLALDRYTTDGTPAFIVTKEKLVGMDTYEYDYDVYKAAARGTEAEGSHLLSLASGVLSGSFLADVPGCDPQVMFIRSGSGDYTFDFTNLLTGEVEHSIPVNPKGISLTAETQRIAYGGSYLYVAPQTRGESQPNGDVYTYMAYFTPDGDLHHTDKLNLGKLVDYATVYTAADAFDPYIFNLDNKREYMALVKRRNAEGAAGNHEELMVVSEDPADAPVFVYAPNDELGQLLTVFYANLQSDTPRLIIVTVKDDKYISTAYKLPMQLFAEGDGSEENPYIITTPGGLDQLKAFPGSHYALGADIDASGYTLAPKNFEFTGSLDGRGHTISNLELNGNAIIPSISRPESAAEGSMAGTVADINFIDPVYTEAKDGTGLLIGQMRGGSVSNVHIYGGRISGQADLAGLVGGAYLGALVENCSVNADIAGSDNSAVGGVVYETRTGAHIRACAFTGNIAGGENIGGIVSSMSNKDDIIENCHVNATITGKNTIGGIAATSAHGVIRFCHVEGAITATEAPRWGGGPKTGGIVGSLAVLAAGESSADEAGTDATIAIEGCYVNLDTFEFTGEADAYDEYPGQNDTMHRIVGESAGNMEPDIIDYDDYWEPIYGDPAAPEAGLKNNYAVNTLDRVSTTIADATDTTEGLGIDPYDTGMGFFSELGWPYGYDSENPWNYSGDQLHPSLYFEGGILVIDPAETTIAIDEEININLTCKGGSISEDDLGGFLMEMTDETIVEVLDMGPLGTETIEGIYVTVKGVKAGTVKLSLGIKGKSADSFITVKDASGINDAVAEGSAISFDGTTVTAAGCAIDVYSTMGVHLLGATDSADLSRLGQGIYIVNARPADGSAPSTLKVRVK